MKTPLPPTKGTALNPIIQMSKNKNDALSITTEKKAWRNMSPKELKRHAKSHADQFRYPSGAAKTAMVEALGDALTTKERREYCPAWESHTIEDQKWCAAIAWLEQDPKWGASRKAKPINIDLNRVLESSADEFAQFAVQYVASKYARGAA